MGLSSTLANALTGLTAAARGAEVVSTNVANARTPGFARREVNLTSISIGGTGGGVRVASVARSFNQTVLNDRRLADAASTNAETREAFLQRMSVAIGQPDDPGALTADIAALGTALVQAASRPDAQARLQSILSAAGAIAGKLADLTEATQQARIEADRSIGAMVGELNSALAGVDRLNADILAERSAGHDATALMDQRQLLVDKIATIVPIRELPRDRDQISLYTAGGAMLLEGNAATIGFTPANVITAGQSLSGGTLSGLTINGMPVQSDDRGVLGGGALGAAFAVRDDLAPKVQAQLDALARDLIERFESPTADPTLTPGSPGLFTDQGAAFAAVNEVGLAGRLTLNPLTDPAQGGALWRLRDGLGATAPGDSGNAAILLSLGDALSAPRVPASGGFLGGAQSAGGLAADLLSQVSADQQSAEAQVSYAGARQTALKELELQDGVDTDAEMQSLLLIQQAYAANARVIQTVDGLIQKLMEM